MSWSMPPSQSYSHISRSHLTNSVIPERREAASPKSISTWRDYGFRALGLRPCPGMTPMDSDFGNARLAAGRGARVSLFEASSMTRSPLGVTISRPSRPRTTSRMRSAMRGSRSIRAWRSCASSTRRLVRVTAVAVARAPSPTQGRDLAEEMAGAQADLLMLERRSPLRRLRRSTLNAPVRRAAR